MHDATEDCPPPDRPTRFHVLRTRENSLCLEALGIDRPIRSLTITEDVRHATVVTVEMLVTEAEADQVRRGFARRRFRLVPVDDEAGDGLDNEAASNGPGGPQERRR